MIKRFGARPSVFLRALLVAVGLLLAAGVFAQRAGTPDRAPRIADAALRHLQSHPESELADVYKFVHQAVLGPGHLMLDSTAAAAYLEREWERVPEQRSGEAAPPLVEELGAEYVRLHLGPYQEEGGSKGELIRALLSSMIARPDSAMLERTWEVTADSLSARAWTDAAELASFSERVREQDWPLLHHSAAYRDAYQPHYRVLRRDVAQRLLEKDR